jgi:hypothetical protein
VLIEAVRAPDGLRKDHPVKVVMRWYRRCILLSAFDGKVLGDPFSPGGGSFTGPFGRDHAAAMGLGQLARDDAHMFGKVFWTTFDQVRGVYLRHVDEMPHHFQLHLMHAAQIIGYKHPSNIVRQWWCDFYLMIVNDAHLFPETEKQMDERLGDCEASWRAREEVVAL